ncbi:SAM-dependent methyltransferase [Caldalkalibacillus uzonensis]|uniref:SAM-dependent methyltransferase n=1 Tax=Caldalkalibacillus uzonensis TaxID=353224 RepID=A0ABU0CSL7_9BACI|nr:PhzF family phenazine biosynthesis isomerase [Caldalkalibacillus uzonensis]MDQ0338027.1 SAM-dependent methyltransferase [Caldalkalibacillus uzonensis]
MRIYIVDSFTDRPFAGNPAAVCLLDASQSEMWMQQVAAEMNLSETAFVMKKEDGFSLRWFTPEVEVDLCGHATLAAAHILWEKKSVLPEHAIAFHTLSGTLTAKERAGWIEVAEEMPYDYQMFDYIVNNFAFHHFLYKTEALDEVARVIKPNGVFKLRNYVAHDMPRWWIYQYFPSTFEEDLQRFWEKERLFLELSARGFTVQLHVHYRMEESRVADFLPYVENRDISILTLISDEEYFRGLEQMKAEIERDPEATFVQEFAELECLAVKA